MRQSQGASRVNAKPTYRYLPMCSLTSCWDLWLHLLYCRLPEKRVALSDAGAVMAVAKVNPSYASTRMTRRNHNGPHLLQKIGGRRTSSFLGEATGLSPEQEPGRKRNKSVDTDAEPLSSSEEEEVEVIVKPLPKRSLEASLAGVMESTAHKKTKGGLSIPSKTTTSPSLPISSLQSDRHGEVVAHGEDWLTSLQSSQKRRKLQTYGGRYVNIHASNKSAFQPPAKASLPLGIEKSSPFQKANLCNSSPEKPHPTSGTQFTRPEQIRPPGLRRSLRSPRDKFTIPAPVRDTSVVSKSGPIFSMPPEIPSGPTSSATAPSEPAAMFETAGEQDDEMFNRSASSSPLSSPNSIASLLLTQEEKDDLIYIPLDEAVYSSPSSTKCPLCNSSVQRDHLESFNRGRRLNIRQQQRFCLSHKVLDAENTRKKRGYPHVNFTALEQDRIPKHIPHLNQILNQNRASSYRLALSSAIKRTRGSHKGLQSYLKEGIVEVAKYGYYGPRGARIMGQAVTTRMSAAIDGALRVDSVARAVGAGVYVSAVLVPELALRLVMEDMEMADEDEQKAKMVLAESAEVGMLLCGDEDEVVRWEEHGGGMDWDG